MDNKEIKELIDAYEDYIKLLDDELTGIIGLAASHDWKSNKYEQGVKCRDRIAKAKARIIPDDMIPMT